jgi:plasmid stabilization system protein ParE
MKPRLLQVAELELDEAMAWYKDRSEAAAARVRDEMLAAKDQIITYPQAWYPLGDGVRRYRLNRFPSGHIYIVDADDILIVAVAHLKRRPGYARSRLSPQVD